MAGMRVVRRESSGVGWSVAESDTGPSSHTAQTKALAVERARADLRGLPGGGRLRVHLANGDLEYERFVEGVRSGIPVIAAQVDRPPTLGEVHQQIKQDGTKMDKGLDGVDTILLVLGYLGVPVTSAAISPEVRDALDGGWLAVFFATLTWTLGCMGAVIVSERSGLLGYPMVFAVTLCFVAALAVATLLGKGVLELDLAASTLPGPFKLVGSFIEAALRTYGWFGSLIGAGVGALLGHRLARLAPERFAV